MVRRIVRWVRRIVLGLLATALVLVGLALALLHTDWGRERLRRRVVASLHAQFPGGVHIGRIDGSVLGDLTLRDVELDDANGQRAITAERVTINLAYTALAGGEIELEKLIIDGLDATVELEPGPTPNVATIYRPSPEPFTWDVALDRVEIHRGRVSIDQGDRVDRIEDLELSARLGMKAEGPVAGALTLAGVLRDRGDAPFSVAASGRVEADGAIAVPDARVQVGRASVVATAVEYRSPRDLRGSIAIAAPEGELARIAPELAAPGFPFELELAVAPAASPGPDGALALTVGGAVAGASLHGELTATPTAARPRVEGQLRITRLDLAALGPVLPPSAIAGAVTLALELEPARTGLAAARGDLAVTGAGTVGEVALDDVRVAATLADGQAAITLHGRGPGGAVVDGHATLADDGDRIALRDGHVEAAVDSIAAATRGVAPADGQARLALDVSGRFGGGAPPALDATVRVDGARVGYDDLRISGVTLTAHASGPPDALTGTARVEARGLRKGRERLPDVTASARGGLTGALDVTVAADDRVRGIAAELAARVELGGADPERVADLALGRYRFVVGRAAIAGQGGRVTLDREQVRVRGLRATGAGGTLAVDARVGLGRRAGQLEGQVVLAGLDLARARDLPGVPPTAAGVIALDVDLAQRGRRVEGEIQASARGLVLGPGARPIDVALSTELRRERVEVALTADGAELGKLTAAVDVDPPARLDDVAAWTRLERSALRAVRLDAERLDLARLATLVGVDPIAEGTLDAELELDADQARLAVRGRRLVADGVPAPVDLDLALDLTDPTTAAVTAKATLREVGTAEVKTAVAMPTRPFDLRAWAGVDLRSVQGVEVRVDEIAVDAAMARRLGLGGVRGTIAATITAEPGLRAINAHLGVRELLAPPLVRPAAVTVDAAITGAGTKATVALDLEGQPVATVEAGLPITVADLLAGRVDPAALPLAATVRIPDSELAPLARALGQSPRLGGRWHGQAEVGGTVRAPTAKLAVVVNDLASRIPRGGGAARGGVRELTIDARYQGGAVHGEVHGRQDGGGSLAVVADVDPTRPDDARVSIGAKQFQLAPLARVAPAILLGVRGVLDADLQLRGTDPDRARAIGVATVSGLQVPIADTIGTLRDGKLELSFGPTNAHAALTGSLESGRVELTANARLAGLMPQSGHLDVDLQDVALITSMAPRLDAKLGLDLVPEGDHYRAAAVVRDASVTIPDEEGRVLHPTSLPADLVFTTDTRPGVPVPRTRAKALKAWLGVRPRDPALLIDLTIEPVEVVSSQFRGEVQGQLAFAIGDDGATIDGTIGVPRGNVVLFERRYTLRDANITFDGGLDPLLDIQLEYEFPQLAMRVMLSERLSKPKLVLSSNPSTYTEGQLLGFLLGGSPGAAGRETVDAATGVAAALASQLIGGFVTRKLPIHLDVLNYEPTTSSSSGAFVLGRWVTSKLLVLYRNRVEAKTDENANEVEAEYWLQRSLLLEGSYGDHSVLGLDLLWNRRW